ncbi:UDP-galactopyranose mutase [Phyllobacterium sp. 21LDTY02-6]|nr:UDP-galactopyranose mutase [Phyllobacterium sp. 21LDTY02-6]
MDMKRILVVGAGFSGAVIARQLAEQNYAVDVIESRAHVAGNCYTETDRRTGITVHRHGPHIFHTDDQHVWEYVQKFGSFQPYTCQVKATTGNRVYSLPINLLTINQFFGQTFSPAEAERFIKSKSENIPEVVSFEDQALNFLGRELYEAFFKGYPIKQWGIHPRELPASVLKRLPVRFDYNDNYFNHRYQGIPETGYTEIVASILRHANISVTLDRAFSAGDRTEYDHVFYSGTLDSWFGHKLGRLGYRTLSFEASHHSGDFQGCAVMSYPEEQVPFTRITEHKHFAPWQKFDETVVFHEYSSLSKPGDTPYYPIRLVNDKAMLSEYVELAKREDNVTFVGRLGTYRYLDMDVTIREALECADRFLELNRSDRPVPAFFHPPL